MKPDPDLKVRTALDRAAARISEKFKGQPLVEASIRKTIGAAYQDLGLFPEAETHLQRAYDSRRNTLGAEHASTLEVLGDLAGLAHAMGKYPEASPYRTVIAGFLRPLYGSCEDRSVLNAMLDLADVYQSQGRYPEAEALDRKVWEAQRRVLGPEHHNTLTAMANLAYTYLLQGRLGEAENLYIKAVDGESRVLGS